MTERHVTPDAVAYSQGVDYVALEGAEEQMTVMPEQVRLITQLVPGEMIARRGGRDELRAVGKG